MKPTYPKYKRGEIEKIYKKFSKESKEEIKKYIALRESIGLEDSSDIRRYVIQTRDIIECDFKEFDTLEKVVNLSKLIKESYLSPAVKKNLRITLKNLFQYFFPDWTSRFMGLKCFSNKNGNGKTEEETYKPSDLPTEEEDEKIIQTEKTIFWKAFFIPHIQSGNRTIETRHYENDKIKFKDDGAEVEIHMTKNNKKKWNILNPQASAYIKKLQEEQKNLGTFGKYLFHTGNPDIPISKNAVNDWFRMITKKAVGRVITPYMWRHRKATELYTLATENKISMDAVAKIMGHSKEMSNTYVHRPEEKTIEILKQQLKNVNTKISPEKEHRLEIEMKKLKKENESLKTELEEYIEKKFNELLGKGSLVIDIKKGIGEKVK